MMIDQLKVKTYKNILAIKTWAEEDRPREKLLNKGKKSLSDAELIAILIRIGSAKETAVGLAQRLLNDVENDLAELGKKSTADLMRFHGIGEAKAIAIIAALEIGRRRQLTAIRDKPQIRSSQDAYNLIAPFLQDLDHEEFWILLLNRANKVISRQLISIGGVSGTVVDAKLIFRRSLEIAPASSIILCHNHPSGNLRPSQADIEITKKLKAAGKTLDIAVLDHLIVADTGFYSFADEGKL